MDLTYLEIYYTRVSAFLRPGLPASRLSDPASCSRLLHHGIFRILTPDANTGSNIPANTTRSEKRVLINAIPTRELDYFTRDAQVLAANTTHVDKMADDRFDRNLLRRAAFRALFVLKKYSVLKKQVCILHPT